MGIDLKFLNERITQLQEAYSAAKEKLDNIYGALQESLFLRKKLEENPIKQKK